MYYVMSVTLSRFFLYVYDGKLASKIDTSCLSMANMDTLVKKIRLELLFVDRLKILVVIALEFFVVVPICCEYAYFYIHTVSAYVRYRTSIAGTCTTA